MNRIFYGKLTTLISDKTVYDIVTVEIIDLYIIITFQNSSNGEQFKEVYKR